MVVDVQLKVATEIAGFQISSGAAPVVDIGLAILPGGVGKIIIGIRLRFIKAPEAIRSPCSWELTGEGILGIQYIFKKPCKITSSGFWPECSVP